MKFLLGLIMAGLLPFHTHAQTDTWNMISTTRGSKLSNIRLISLRDDHLIFEHANAIHRMHIDTIASLIREKGGTKIVRSLIVGAVGLGAAGYLVGLALDKSEGDASSWNYYSSQQKEGNMKVILPVLGTAVGAGLGAVFAPSREVTEINLSVLSHEDKIKTVRSILEEDPQAAKVNSRSASMARDDVYLKNGNIIRGNVVELIPDSIVKIETDDQSLFVFRMSEVDVIRNNGAQALPSKFNEGQQATDLEIADFTPERRTRFSVSPALGLPTGEYADGAKPGFGFRGELSVPFHEAIAWTASVSGSFNAVKGVSSTADVSPISTVFALTGLQITAGHDRSVVPFVHGQVGALFASIPSMGSLSYSGGTAFGFGVGAGMIFAKRFHVAVDYLKGTPEYEYSTSVLGIRVQGKMEVPVSIIMLSVGVSMM